MTVKPRGRWSRGGLLVALTLALGAQAAPVRMLLSIGHDRGGLDDVPLKHAQADAERVRDVFVEVGSVRPEDATLVVGQPASAVSAALGAMTARAAALRAEGREVMALVYVSSHAATGTLHLGGTELPLPALRAGLQGVGAGLSLLVVDACTSGVVVRKKGASRTVAQAVEATLVRGTVVISSSGPAEASQEWDSLSGSLFTHHWLAALRGAADLDRDGRVTLGEAYRHAHARTVAAAEQHPGFDFDLSGSGDVVLTTPLRARSAVELSAALAGRFVVVSDDGPGLVLEVQKAADAPLRLALPPGRYRLQRRTGSTAAVATVDLPWGGLRFLDTSDFVQADAVAVALKGGGDRFSAGLFAGVVSQAVASPGPVPVVGLWGRSQLGALFLGAGVDLGATSATLRHHQAQELLASVAVHAGVGAQWAQMRLGVALLGRGTLVTQGLTRADALDAERLFGLSPVERRAGLLVEGGVMGSVELALVGPVLAGLQAEGLVRRALQDGAATTSFAGRLGLVTGVRF